LNSLHNTEPVTQILFDAGNSHVTYYLKIATRQHTLPPKLYGK